MQQPIVNQILAAMAACGAKEITVEIRAQRAVVMNPYDMDEDDDDEDIPGF